ncbi:unnamed protein product [Rhizophagus irregularis]|uniref:Uncharacterized protein n=1 Tax=Rhizophagus irregularis TaxID=588596 RepID=A0A2I1GZS1_9GLOM|nr:hypothetical protein RhiirA4_469575 [Rhizophagus irregularis]CAB4405530.1 unnamed protein product [Rhizophagus irregularis]
MENSRNETAISATSAEQEYMMKCSGNRWYEGSSNHNDRYPMYLLLKKYSSSEKINDSQKTNKIFNQISKLTGNLDNTLKEKSYISFYSVNNFIEIKMPEIPLESEEDFVWSINNRFYNNQIKDSEKLTDVQLKESAHIFEWESVDKCKILRLQELCENQRGISNTPVEERSFYKDVHNFNRKLTNEGIMQKLFANDAIQYEHTLLNLLKSKYPFHEETNQNILYNYEIRRLADFYNITNFYPVLTCYDITFWLKGLNGTIYMWSHADESMIFGGHNLKEALINFLFYQENLYYIEEYTHKLISVKKVKKEVAKSNEEGLKTAIVITDDKPLKPLKDEKKGSKKGRKQKKQQKNKNK